MRLTALPLAGLLLAAALALPATAQPRLESGGASVGLTDITPHLEAQFPWQREVMPGIASVALARPVLRLPDDRAELAVDIAVTTLGSTTSLGRATLSSGLRLDGSTAALYLDAPRMVGFTQPDGQPLVLEPSMASLIDEVLASYARSQPVYRLPAEMAPMASRVEAVQVRDGRLHVRFKR